MENVCRLCLSNDSLIDVFHESVHDSLYEMIFTATGVVVQVTDSVSKRICTKCYQIVLNVHRFRELATTVNQLLYEKFESKNALPQVDQQTTQDVRVNETSTVATTTDRLSEVADVAGPSVNNVNGDNDERVAVINSTGSSVCSNDSEIRITKIESLAAKKSNASTDNCNGTGRNKRSIEEESNAPSNETLTPKKKKVQTKPLPSSSPSTSLSSPATVSSTSADRHCHLCPYETSSYKSYVNHTATHRICKPCDLSFKRTREWKRHIHKCRRTYAARVQLVAFEKDEELMKKYGLLKGIQDGSCVENGPSSSTISSNVPQKVTRKRGRPKAATVSTTAVANDENVEIDVETVDEVPAIVSEEPESNILQYLLLKKVSRPVLETSDNVATNDRSSPVLITNDNDAPNDRSSPVLITNDNDAPNDRSTPILITKDNVAPNDRLSPILITKDNVAPNDRSTPVLITKDNVASNDRSSPILITKDNVAPNDRSSPVLITKDNVAPNDRSSPVLITNEDLQRINSQDTDEENFELILDEETPDDDCLIVTPQVVDDDDDVRMKRSETNVPDAQEMPSNVGDDAVNSASSNAVDDLFSSTSSARRAVSPITIKLKKDGCMQIVPTIVKQKDSARASNDEQDKSLDVVIIDNDCDDIIVIDDEPADNLPSSESASHPVNVGEGAATTVASGAGESLGEPQETANQSLSAAVTLQENEQLSAATTSSPSVNTALDGPKTVINETQLNKSVDGNVNLTVSVTDKTVNRNDHPFVHTVRPYVSLIVNSKTIYEPPTTALQLMDEEQALKAIFGKNLALCATNGDGAAIITSIGDKLQNGPIPINMTIGDKMKAVLVTKKRKKRDGKAKDTSPVAASTSVAQQAKSNAPQVNAGVFVGNKFPVVSRELNFAQNPNTVTTSSPHLTPSTFLLLSKPPGNAAAASPSPKGIVIPYNSCQPYVKVKNLSATRKPMIINNLILHTSNAMNAHNRVSLLKIPPTMSVPATVLPRPAVILPSATISSPAVNSNSIATSNAHALSSSTCESLKSNADSGLNSRNIIFTQSTASPPTSIALACASSVTTNTATTSSVASDSPSLPGRCRVHGSPSKSNAERIASRSSTVLPPTQDNDPQRVHKVTLRVKHIWEINAAQKM